MAIDFRLKMATPMPVREFAEILLEEAQAADLLTDKTTVDDILDGTVTTHHTWIRALVQKSSLPYDIVEDSFGFTPTLRVDFRQHRGYPNYLQSDDQIFLVNAMLRRVPGDAVYYYDEVDEVYLLRRNDEISVRDNTDVWPEHRLALLTLPYQRATHRFT